MGSSKRTWADRPRPAVLEGNDLHALVGLEGQVVALGHQGAAGVGEPVGWALDRLGVVGRRRATEERGALEAPAAAAGAGRDFVALLKGDREAARIAPERARPGERSGSEGFHV